MFNPVSGEFTTFSRYWNKEHTVPSYSIYNIIESKDGMLWIGGDIGGVCRLDIRDLSFSNPDRLQMLAVTSSNDHKDMSTANARSLFQDSFGNIWVGNYGEGLDFIRHTQPDFHLVQSVDNVSELTKRRDAHSAVSDREGNIWVGGDNEILLINNGEIKRKYRLTGDITRPTASVYAMLNLEDRLLVSIFKDGIFSLDKTSGQLKRLIGREDRNYANCFYSSPDGHIYIGMQNGLYEYSEGRIIRDDKISSTINHLIPNGIATDCQGKLWIGTYGDGIFIFDKNGDLMVHLDDTRGLSSNAIKQLYLDSSGSMWIAGQDGLSRITDTAHPENIVSYDYTSGLNETSILSLQEDSEGNMWLGTNHGLSRWNQATGKFDNYDYHDGLPHSSPAERSACIAPDGTLYFGFMKGICYFNPRTLETEQTGIPVRIVECQSIVAPTEKRMDENGGLQVEEKITLPYDMNSLRIVFSVPDFSQSRIVEYSYMVEGLDNDWIMAGSKHEALLRNLPPGEYTFKVRAKLRNQEWSEDNISEMRITVTPPIWLTWYAKVFYLFAILSVIYLLVHFYKHRLLLKNSLEMERRKSADEQQLNNERLRFYTNITHELRTPLTLILGPLEDLVADRQLPAAYRKRVETIHTSATRLLNLINQILEFRKTETQNRRLAVSKGQISSVVTEIGLRYKELNHNKKVTIDINIADNIPEIYFDSDVIHTILNNLLSNAVKYTPEGSINLNLTTIDLPDGNYVEISVADTGYGIDEKALPHIFERYYQAEGNHQASGTGIGLALVRSLSELHEGCLTVESKVGKGTIFIFRLKSDNTYPTALHKEDREESVPEKEAEEKETLADTRPVVLVVEDNDDIREYIETSLNTKFQILTAANGQEGLELANKKLPDVIVSDVMMPIMDGMELCRRIKGDIATSHIPVILLTAKDSIQDKETGYEIGADSYLTKPFSAKLLINRINNILNSRKLLASLISSKVSGSGAATQVVVTDTGDSDEPAIKLSKLDEEFLHKFKTIVEENITKDTLDMTFMQKSLGMSHSTLYRKVKSLTGMSGNELIRKIRLKKGYELLKEGHNVSEAAYASGFNDVGYFRNCFKDEYGMSPSQFIKQRQP